ncbi:hypothetical protein DFH27DRAFT_372479 [Peziza echinospora]|nr:hypothetical protein DFH27DRAFT_372479 [Peziza echinospora]
MGMGRGRRRGLNGNFFHLAIFSFLSFFHLFCKLPIESCYNFVPYVHTVQFFSSPRPQAWAWSFSIIFFFSQFPAIFCKNEFLKRLQHQHQ